MDSLSVVEDLYVFEDVTTGFFGCGVGAMMNRFGLERAIEIVRNIGANEELMYYRIFRDHFGELEELSWMGRTGDAPVAQAPVTASVQYLLRDEMR